MIFWKLFYTFCKIGIFNFGGGYAMIALIQNEVVEKQGWMTMAEFTDIVATSQITPGPIGINVATYAGYTAVVNAGYDPFWGVAGAFLASFSVILLPFILILLISKYLLDHRFDVVRLDCVEKPLNEVEVIDASHGHSVRIVLFESLSEIV